MELAVLTDRHVVAAEARALMPVRVPPTFAKRGPTIWSRIKQAGLTGALWGVGLVFGFVFGAVSVGAVRLASTAIGVPILLGLIVWYWLLWLMSLFQERRRA